MILAADALSRTTPGSALFRDLPPAAGRWPGARRARVLTTVG